MNSVRDELMDEDVVVSCVADRAANHADSKSQGGDCGDKIIRADDGGNDRGRNDNAANT